MYAATPPARCALATTWRQGVAVPLHSGAKISVTRPRGIPPTPIAASRLIAPVGMDSTRTRSVDPIFMMAPLPQFFSIWAIARFSAFFLSSLTVDTAISFHPVVRRFDLAGRWDFTRAGRAGTANNALHPGTRTNYETPHKLSRFPKRNFGLGEPRTDIILTPAETHSRYVEPGRSPLQE